ncbi:MAG: YcxB family protein [Clostridia bacterium]|nr:YcxB family protein [Clostridia bacterium]
MNDVVQEMGLFSTTGVIDDGFYRKNSRYMIPFEYKKFLLLLTLGLMAICVMLAVSTGEPVFYTGMVICVITGAARYLVDRHGMVKKAVARLKETYPDGAVTLTTSFHEDGMHILNEHTGGQSCIAYDRLAWARETEDHVLLGTKAGQFNAVFKNGLDQQMLEELAQYLRNRGVKVQLL